MKSNPSQRIVTEILARHAGPDGDRPAIEAPDRSLSYRELAAHVARERDRLVRAGVKPADRVLLVAPTSVELAVGLLAVLACGAVAVPIPTTSSEARCKHLVESMAIRLVIVGTGVQPLSTRSHRVDLETDDSSVRAAIDLPPPTGPSLILLSSGSTGVPKGVMLGDAELLHTARTLAKVFGIDRSHRELIISPLCHSDGFQRAAATWLAGGCVVLSDGLFSINGLLEDLRDRKITGFFAPPPIVRYLLQASPLAVRAAGWSCRTIELGSASFSAAELAAFVRLFAAARVFYHYGLTECSRAMILDLREAPEKLTTVGRAAPGVEIAIVDPRNRRQLPGEPGQIFLRGPQRTLGYFRRPDLDRERLIAAIADERDDGSPWLATGDHGVLDIDGYLTLLGRADDLINSAGHHFFPAEVEMELGACDDIADYLVAGVADPRGILGDVPWAFVVPRAPEQFRPREFLSRAKARLPGHMVPRHVVVVPSLPATPSGKPDRRRAVELYAKMERAS